MLPGETILSGADDKCPDCGKPMPFEVLRSNAGFYIGTWCPCSGPYSRETGYYRTREEAARKLADGSWTQDARK